MKKIFTTFVLLIVATCTLFAEYKIVSTNDCEGYKSMVINYTSVGADCVTPATVSGVITIPTENLMGTAVWVIDNHHTFADNASAPSVAGTTPAGKGGFSKNFVMIATDYLGYGVSVEERHPFLCQRQNALNSIDLLKVALQILPEQGINPIALFNMGYSQGGGVAMAVQRELESMKETDPVIGQLLSSVKGFASWCGSGPYDPVTTGNMYYEMAEKVSFPALLPLLVNGFLAGAPEEIRKEYKFSDFFQESLVNTATFKIPFTETTITYPGLDALIASKKYDNNTASIIMIGAAGLRQNLGAMFSDEMSNRESQIANDFFAWLKLNNAFEGWKPVYPISLYHLEEDDIVTVENTKLAAEALEVPAARVHYFSLKEEGMGQYNDHSNFGPFFFGKVAEEIAAMLKESSIETLDAEKNNGPQKILEEGKIKIRIGNINYDMMGRRIR